MSKDIYAIKCSCRTNPDVEGTWTRYDMQNECRDFGFNEDEWMSWLFNHIFSDYPEWTSEIEDVFIKSNSISKMDLVMGTDCISLVKVFK